VKSDGRWSGNENCSESWSSPKNVVAANERMEIREVKVPAFSERIPAFVRRSCFCSLARLLLPF
jgi:hypothetical protein